MYDILLYIYIYIYIHTHRERERDLKIGESTERFISEFARKLFSFEKNE